MDTRHKNKNNFGPLTILDSTIDTGRGTALIMGRNTRQDSGVHITRRTAPAGRIWGRCKERLSELDADANRPLRPAEP